MRRIILTALIICLAVGTAAAQSCDSKAVSANGKPLHGAAKMSFVKKCKRDICGPKAVSAGRQAASRCGQEQFHDEVHEGRLERLACAACLRSLRLAQRKIIGFLQPRAEGYGRP